MSECKIDNSRRNFVGKTSIAAAGLSIMPGVFLHSIAQAKPDDQPVSDKNRWGMLIDTNKCTDCGECVSACNEENGITSNGPERQATDAQWIRKVKLKDKANGHTISLPMMCQHCEHPPCVDVCPTGASFRRDDGIVLVDKHICIGCRYCMMACPYKARSFVHETITDQKVYAPRGKGTVEACTLCVHRVDKNGAKAIPACVEACSDKAMIFGDLKDPSSEISKDLKARGGKQIRADLMLNTGVRYRGI